MCTGRPAGRAHGADVGADLPGWSSQGSGCQAPGPEAQVTRMEELPWQQASGREEVSEPRS